MPRLRAVVGFEPALVHGKHGLGEWAAGADLPGLPAPRYFLRARLAEDAGR